MARHHLLSIVDRLPQQTNRKEIQINFHQIIITVKTIIKKINPITVLVITIIITIVIFNRPEIVVIVDVRIIRTLQTDLPVAVI